MNIRVPIATGEAGRQQQVQPPRSDIVTLATPGAKRAFAEFAGSLFRRKYIVAGTILFVTALATLVAYQIQPRYTASAYVMIDARQQRVVDNPTGLSGLPVDAASIDSQVQLLRSRSLAEKIVDRLELANDPEFNGALRPPPSFDWGLFSPRALMASLFPGSGEESPRTGDEIRRRQKDAVIDAYLSRLSVRRQGISYLIAIDFTSAEAAKAARVANTVADAYLTDQLDAKFEATRRAGDWLNSRLSGLREQVRQSEQAVEDYRAQANLVNGVSRDQTLNSQQLADLNTQFVAARAKVAEEEAKMRQADRMLTSGTATDTIAEVLSSPLISNLRTQESEIKNREAELSTRYGPRHPLMINVQAQRKEIETKISEEVSRVVQNLRNNLAVAVSRQNAIQRSVDELRRVAVVQNRDEIRLRELEREAEANRTIYETFLTRFKQSREEDTIQQPDVRIVSQAPAPLRPSYPNKTFIVVLAFFGSVCAGVLFALLVDRLDSGFRTAGQVEEVLGAPNLALVPRLQKALGPKVSPEDALVKSPMSAFGEALRGLYSALLLSSVDNPPKVVLFASALPNEGKSTLAMSFARLNALSGRRVLIIDLDLRKPSLGRRLGRGKLRDIKSGVVEVLTGDAKLEDVIVRDEPSGAYVLPAKPGVRSPTDVINSRQMRQLIDRLREKFDLVVIDSSPLLLVSDAKLATRLADTTLLLVKWESTAREAAAGAIAGLREIGAPLAGVVLNQVDMRRYSTYGYGAVPYYYRGPYRAYYGK